MEKKYLENTIDRNLQPIWNAPDSTKRSAEMDADSKHEPYGFMRTHKDMSSFQSWFNDINTIYEIVAACNEHGGYTTRLNITTYDKNGKKEGFDHTSFDGRVEDLKKAIDSGAYAHSDFELIVYKVKKDFFDESMFKEIYRLSRA